MAKCIFCGDDCDGKLVIRSAELEMKDGSDMIVCNICFDLFAEHDFDELYKRVRKSRGGKK